MATEPMASGLRPGRAAPSGLLGFACRRFGALIFLALGITFVSFVLTQLVPGNPALATLGLDATPQAIEAFDQRYGLEKPLPVRYERYLVRVMHGDLGVSQQTQNPVTHDLESTIPATAELAVASVFIAIIFGGTLGVLSAIRRDTWLDYVFRIVSLGGVSLPTFWIALVSLYLLYFKFGIFPGGGRLDPTTLPPPHLTGAYILDAAIAGKWSTLVDALRHLILPALVLAAFNIGVLTRYTRSAILEVIDQEYVQAARAKGLRERDILFGHVLRAALPSIVTVLGLMFANALVGAVLVENVFSWPGLGQYGYRAATSLDLPAIAAVSIFVAIVYVIINFLVDVCHGLLDPRIRLSS